MIAGDPIRSRGATQRGGAGEGADVQGLKSFEILGLICPRGLHRYAYALTRSRTPARFCR
jgi:hypothetical protein